MEEYTRLTTYILFMKQYNFQGRYWKPSALSELMFFFSELSTATVDTKRERPDGKLYCFINISITLKALYILEQDTLSMCEV